MDWTSYLSYLETSTLNGQDTYIQIAQIGNSSIVGVYQMSIITDQTTHFNLSCSLVTSSGSLTTGLEYSITFHTNGPIGPTGTGIPSGGATGDFLSKNSTANYDVSWSSSVISSIPPGASTDPGSTGQAALDSDYLYICVGTDTWKRVEITGW
jgi:hypothetical protein